MKYLNINTDKITVSTTDVNYVSYLIQKGNIQEAKQVLANLKSTIDIINDLINQTQNNLISVLDATASLDAPASLSSKQNVKY